MTLLNISQIKGLPELRADLDQLLKSYEAAKLATTIAKNETENYNVEELAAELKAKLDDITGENGNPNSLGDIKKGIDGLKEKTLKVYTGDNAEPVKEYKLTELPEDALLHAGELDIKAYQDALDALVAKLAANRELISAVKDKMGDKGVQSQIENALKSLEKSLEAIAEKEDFDKTDAVVKALDEKVRGLEGKTEILVLDEIALGKDMKQLKMTEDATDREVRIYVNGGVYFEGDYFTVDRKAKTIDWTFTKANGGFDLTSENADKVTVKYYATMEVGGGSLNPSLIQVDESKILLTKAEPMKSFNVTIPAGCTLEVIPSDPEAVEVTVTEVA